MKSATRWLATLHVLLLGLVAAAHGQGSPNPANAGSPLGINIDGLAYWSTEWPLLDEMKRARFQWLTQCNRRAMGGCDHLQPPALAGRYLQRRSLRLRRRRRRLPGPRRQLYALYRDS